MRPVQLGLPFIARIFHGPLYNSEGESLSCAVPEQPTAPLAMATNQRATRLFVESFIFDNENAKRFWETLRYAMECRLDMNRILSRLISRREYFKLFSFHFRDYKNRTTSFVLKIGKYYPFSFCVALHIFSKKPDGDMLHFVASYKYKKKKGGGKKEERREYKSAVFMGWKV